MERLVLAGGNASPTELLIEGEVLLGRAKTADVRLLDETASRRHAALRVVDGRLSLVDLGSANGTRLNGEAVDRPAALFDGDVIEIGGVRLRFQVDGASEGADTRVAARDTVVEAVDPDQADPGSEASDEAAKGRLRLVCDLATALTDAGDAAEIPTLLVQRVVEALTPDRMTVLLRDASGGVAVAAGHPRGASAPSSRTLTDRVLERGEAVRMSDGADEGPGPQAASLVRGRFRCTLAAPLRTAEGVLGAVVVEAEAPDRYSAADLTALAAVTRQAALALRNLRNLSAARLEVRHLSEQRATGTRPLLGASEAMNAVREQIHKAAAVDSPVLVTGETGTGKELVARCLHAEGPRPKAPFVALNCAALVEGLLESELFGHEKGAFTGANERRDGRIAEAGDGVLFLDEVGDLPLALQAKLLRVLSEGTYTRVGGREPLALACRIVAATNRDLAAMVEEGRFRRDLYYRLAVLVIATPPLRERPGDVDELVDHALEAIAGRLGRRVPRLAADAREALGEYPWPGNVRELLNVLERALVLAGGDTITRSDLPLEIRDGLAAPARTDEEREVLTLREAEKRAVVAALKHTGGRKGEAARLLGTSWPTLNRKIREYGL